MAESQTALTITPAVFPEDREVVAELFTSYATSLDIDLSFQRFEDELASLPGKYALEKGGALFLAFSTVANPSQSTNTPLRHKERKAIGCVALRSLEPNAVCELKRLYVSPESRGSGAGKRLLEVVIEIAKELGYREMLLDTLPTMVEARKMYGKFGFESVEKYYENPVENTSYMRLRLGQ